VTRPIRLLLALLLVLSTVAIAAAQTPFQNADHADKEPPHDHNHDIHAAPVGLNWSDQIAPIKRAAVSLPVAGILAAALAFRPKRRGTPRRQPAVIQTQIILALVGAVVMLIVGQSLARAFGIVGAAGLVRYRAKVEDPKDAGVMLSTLALGLACGVGHFMLAGFAAFIILVCLWVIESLEPEQQKIFDLKVTTKDGGALRPRVEGILRQFDTKYELRTSANEEISYEVKLPWGTRTDKVSNEIMRAADDDGTAVQWEEKKKAKA
jgi:uncharacterized membrane protein YhiD involved in acid resistance